MNKEAPIPIATLDSVVRQKLIDLSATKVSLSSTDVKSACMEQMLILGKMGVHRLMENAECKHDCCTHECKHC